jgi:hypothetical protein
MMAQKTSTVSSIIAVKELSVSTSMTARLANAVCFELPSGKYRKMESGCMRLTATEYDGIIGACHRYLDFFGD